MLIEEFDETTNRFKCYDSGFKWWCMTGYGDTKDAAKIAYFNINIIKYRDPIIRVTA